MDPFRPSPRGIPLGEASAYFINFKKLAGLDVAPDGVDYSPLEEPPEPSVKEAADKSDAEQVEVGRQRGIANASSGFTTDSMTRGERLGDLLGRLIGGGVGVHAGNALTPPGSSPAVMLAGRLGGVALGQHAGARAGKALGQELDGYVFRNKQWKEAPEEKTATCAAEEVQRLIQAPRTAGRGEYQPFGHVPPYPEGHMVPGRLKSESRVDRQGHTTNVAGVYPGLQLGADIPPLTPDGMSWDDRFKIAAQEMGLLPPPEEEATLDSAQTANELEYYRSRFQQVAQEMGLLQQQNEELQAQVDQTQEQQQAALDQATLIQQQAMQNAQAAHEAASTAMQNTMQAQTEALVNKQESMQVRDHLQGIKQTLVDVASQIPDIGGLPTTPSPMGMDPSMGQQGPAPAEAPMQEQAPPTEGASPEQPPAPAGANGQGQAGDQGKLSIKVGNAGLLGALGGAAVGAAGTALEARRPLDGLRGKVEQLEARESGGGSFLNALNLAQSKFQLALREAAQSHPTAATAAGAVLGATAGSRAAPAIQTLLE